MAIGRYQIAVKLGNGLLFDGSTVTLKTSSPVSTAQNNFTACAWVYPTSFGSGNTAILKNGETGVGNGGYFLFLTSSGDFKVSLTGTATTLDSGVTLSLNTWTHLAFIRNSGTCQCYVNGVAQGSSNSGTPNGIQSSTTVGCQYSTSTSTFNDFFNGIIDDVRIYDRVLTSLELSNLASNVWPDLTATTSLKVYWKFDETSGQPADSSSNNIVATMQNGTYTTGKVYITNVPNRTVAGTRSAATGRTQAA